MSFSRDPTPSSPFGHPAFPARDPGYSASLVSRRSSSARVPQPPFVETPCCQGPRSVRAAHVDGISDRKGQGQSRTGRVDNAPPAGGDPQRRCSAAPGPRGRSRYLRVKRSSTRLANKGYEVRLTHLPKAAGHDERQLTAVHHPSHRPQRDAQHGGPPGAGLGGRIARGAPRVVRTEGAGGAHRLVGTGHATFVHHGPRDRSGLGGR